MSMASASSGAWCRHRSAAKFDSLENLNLSHNPLTELTFVTENVSVMSGKCDDKSVLCISQIRIPDYGITGGATNFLSDGLAQQEESQTVDFFS